jgi:S-adenosylmethionine-diacylgycerolhomoserine-N-methlytransferase
VLRRYALVGPAYDVISGEWPLYRPPRVGAVVDLRLRPGDHVVDVGCGTGLNFALLQDAVGESGSVTGIDASRQMLRSARRRVTRAGWTNVLLHHGDASVAETWAGLDRERYDAAIATYALSLMPDWERAWRHVLARAAGGRVAVVDLDLPRDAPASVRSLARLACWLGGSSPLRRPWATAERDLDGLVARDYWGGHVRARAGRARLGDLA